jgi:hypothetical protein
LKILKFLALNFQYLFLATLAKTLRLNYFTMDKEFIEKGNITIAEFLGGSVESFIDSEDLPETQVYFPSSEWGYDLSDLAYSHNWSWLMPAVEEIEKTKDKEYGWFQVTIRGNTCSIESEHLWKVIQGIDTDAAAYMSDCNAIFLTKIESTFYNVVQFINWYKKNT